VITKASLTLPTLPARKKGRMGWNKSLTRQGVIVPECTACLLSILPARVLRKAM